MNYKQLQQLIFHTLSIMDANLATHHKMNRPEAVQLLLGTACVESDCGHFIMQKGNGTARGIYQMEPATHDDIWHNYINHRPQLKAFMRGELGETLLPVKSDSLRWNLRYATMMTRLHYYRVAEAIPTTTPTEQATYWKQHYNTPNGKGRIEDYLIKSEKYT